MEGRQLTAWPIQWSDDRNVFGVNCLLFVSATFVTKTFISENYSANEVRDSYINIRGSSLKMSVSVVALQRQLRHNSGTPSVALGGHDTQD